MSVDGRRALQTPTDPRVGKFQVLVVVSGRRLLGDWKFDHVGYGEHGFADQSDGRWVPNGSVLWAEREKHELE